MKVCLSVELVWSHFGTLHRVTAWPELEFAAQVDGQWIPYEPDPSDDSFVSAAVMLDRQKWEAFLEFVPVEVSALVRNFKYGRLAALVALHRCPTLMQDLTDTPALVPFVAAHVALRGSNSPRWEEITALHERGGLFLLLEWLGLPASRQTLEILRKIADADLSRRLLEPLRSSLWEPESIWLLQHAEVLTEQEISNRCHALAA
jgi:hypothetical protein